VRDNLTVINLLLNRKGREGWEAEKRTGDFFSAGRTSVTAHVDAVGPSLSLTALAALVMNIC
jgi:hypothetical protein